MELFCPVFEKSMIIIHVFKYTDTGILYKILNFEEGLSRKDKLYNRLTEEFRQRLLDFPRLYTSLSHDCVWFIKHTYHEKCLHNEKCKIMKNVYIILPSLER